MKTSVTRVTARQALVASPQLLTPLPRASAPIAIVRIRVVVAVITRAIMTICNCIGTGNVHCPKAMDLTRQIGTKETCPIIRRMLEKGCNQQRGTSVILELLHLIVSVQQHQTSQLRIMTANRQTLVTPKKKQSHSHC